MKDFAPLLEQLQGQLRPRLENWRRWCIGGTAQGHCASIEHRYRSPQWGHWDSTPPSIQGPVNTLDAEAINAAWQKLNWQQRQIIKRVYINRWERSWICSKLRINRSDYEEAHYFSLIALNSLLKTQAQRRNVRCDNVSFGPLLLLSA